MVRSYNGRLTKTVLPDETIIFTYKEKKCTEEQEKYTFNTVTIIKRIDGTTIRVNQDGDICIITSKERLLKNSKGANEKFGRDFDYLFDLNGKPRERKSGSYTCNLKKGIIWTRDDENNYFEMDVDSMTKSKLSVTLEGLDASEKRLLTPRLNDEQEYIDEDLKFLAPPR